MKKSEFVKYLKEAFKNSLTEISPELFRKASEKSSKMGQDHRTVRMSNTFFNKFIGKQIMGGEITNITNYNDDINIFISKVVPNTNPNTTGNIKKSGVGAIYDIKNDQYNVRELPKLNRVDVRILQLIALKANPNTKYKNGVQDLPVVGY